MSPQWKIDSVLHGSTVLMLRAFKTEQNKQQKLKIVAQVHFYYNMGLVTSKEKRNNSVNDSNSRDSEILPTILPLDTEVRVHLVPKFYTSEERGFKRSYCLLVTLQRFTVDLHHSVVKWDQDMAANVEFHEHRLGSVSASSWSFHRRLFSRSTRNRPMTVNSISSDNIDVTQVKVKENDSLRITGVFKSNSGGIKDLTSCEAFDLILCPSFRIKSQCSDWVLLGTLYTKHADSKHRRHWRAAVKADYS